MRVRNRADSDTVGGEALDGGLGVFGGEGHEPGLGVGRAQQAVPEPLLQPIRQPADP